MAKEILKIRIDNGAGNNDPTFKCVELHEYSGKFPRMGFPDLTATLMWPTPLDDEWTHKEYVVLRGERFYVTDTPDAEKTNDKIPYRHSIGFTSEFARILGNTYFEDYVPDQKSGIESQTKNKPCSNNSKFTFYGTIAELCDRLNCSFIKAGIGDSILKTKTSLTTLDTPVGDGYCVMLDPYGVGNIYDPDKTYEFSWEDKTHWETITEGFNITEIPFERRKKAIVFGAIPKVVEHKFEYGHDNELLSVAHKNAKAKVINRITMFGSPDNIPYYYPNETEYGHISIETKPTNRTLTANMVEIAHMTTLLSRLNADTFAVLCKYQNTGAANAVEVQSFRHAFDKSSLYGSLSLGQVFYHKNAKIAEPSPWHIRVFFNVTTACDVTLWVIKAKIWIRDKESAEDVVVKDYIGVTTVESLKSADGTADYISQVQKTDDAIDLGHLPVGEYCLQFSIPVRNIDGNRREPVDCYCSLTSVGLKSNVAVKTGYYWQVGDKRYDTAGALGVKISATLTDAMVGDGFGWKASERMPFQDHLVPPKYRDTLGAERYYNALNNSYIDPDTGDAYEFPNPYTEGAPSEHIYKNEDIKPTIEGVTNASGQLFGEIAGVAYDADDNDALKPDSTEDGDKNDALKYEHSFFYIKLNIFNGDYGFDLFAHASQTDAMTIQMRDGSCNGCKFKIQAAKFTDADGLETYKNPIVVKDGVATGVVSEEGIKESDLDPDQQNTQTHSIWICVQKDAQTFGRIYPNKGENIKPQIGDRFNIINIDLPQAYILAAEKRLEEEGIRFMADNNEEKFTFDISASRIFFAEHPEVLDELNEYSVIKVKYNGKVYEQYVNQLTIDCKDSEPLPNIGIDLTDELTVGESFVQQVAERASSLIANSATMGGMLGTGGGGLSTALADLRYISKAKPDRTPHRLNVGDTLTAEAGAHFGDFVQGQYTGHGGAVDGSGNAEFESIVSRSYLKVMELIYNRLNAQEGDTTFSDFGTIDAVFTQGENRVVQLRKRWDGDFTAFQQGDIIYGYVNDLDKAGGKEWYKAWAWIVSVDRNVNQLVIAEYPDVAVPSGKNHPLTEGMTITRWGNVTEPTMEAYINPAYRDVVIGKRGNKFYNKRQQTFYISTDDGNIVELMGVNKPILEQYNYGTVLGKIPEGLLDPKTQELVNPDQPYLYARGIIVQDLIRINYKGVPVRTANYRGQWNAQTAASDTDYYNSTTTSYDTVTWDGALWQCVVPGSTDEPSEHNPSWLKMTAGFNDGKELQMWVINPSTNIVSVRQDVVEPSKLSATVTLNSSDKSPTVFTSNLDLYDAGAELWYSADGVTWERFTMGVTEPLDLEDETGVIELENSEDNSHILTVGGDDIDTDTIGDRIYFELRSVEDGAVLAKTEVPVVKDGTNGEDGKDGADGKDGKDGKDGISVRLDPPVLELKRGTAGVYHVRIYITDADGEHGVSSFSTLTDEQKEGFMTVHYIDEGGYTFVYDGKATVNRNIPVLADDKYNLTLQIRTNIDGLPGRDGLLVYPAGNYSPDVVYTAKDETCPVVLDGEEYFRLKNDTEYYGNDAPEDRKTPSLDVANGGDDAVWVHFDRFDSIFAKIIMADFAKLGQAVFYGNWMISQKGTDQNGAASDSYQDFKDGFFTPNIAINFKDGTGSFRGNIRADGLTLGAQMMKQQAVGNTEWELLTGALVIASENGRYALPKLAGGCSRVIEIMCMRYKRATFNGFRLRGATDAVYVGEGGDFWDNSKYAMGGNESGAADYVCDEPGLYRAVGFCIEDADGNLTIWNVSRSADGAEARETNRVCDDSPIGTNGPFFDHVVGDAIKFF